MSAKLEQFYVFVELHIRTCGQADAFHGRVGVSGPRKLALWARCVCGAECRIAVSLDELDDAMRVLADAPTREAVRARAARRIVQ